MRFMRLTALSRVRDVALLLNKGNKTDECLVHLYGLLLLVFCLNE